MRWSHSRDSRESYGRHDGPPADRSGRPAGGGVDRFGAREERAPRPHLHAAHLAREPPAGGGGFADERAAGPGGRDRPDQEGDGGLRSQAQRADRSRRLAATGGGGYGERGAARRFRPIEADATW